MNAAWLLFQNEYLLRIFSLCIMFNSYLGKEMDRGTWSPGINLIFFFGPSLYIGVAFCCPKMLPHISYLYHLCYLYIDMRIIF